MTAAGDLFAGLASQTPAAETVSLLLAGGAFRVERIVSFGHASPPGFWYDQPQDEWVLVVGGAARLRFEGGEAIELRPGSFIDISAGRRHRVEWTEPGVPTVWLAIHYSGAGA